MGAIAQSTARLYSVIRNDRGATLVELLVAVALLSLSALLAEEALYTTLKARLSLGHHLHEADEFHIASSIIRKQVEMVTSQPVYIGSVHYYGLTGTSDRLSFVTEAPQWNLSSEAMQLVTIHTEGADLVEDFSDPYTRAPSLRDRRVLLHNLKAFAISYLPYGKDAEYQDTWPLAREAPKLVTFALVVVGLPSFETTRLVVHPSAAASVTCKFDISSGLCHEF